MDQWSHGLFCHDVVHRPSFAYLLCPLTLLSLVSTDPPKPLRRAVGVSDADLSSVKIRTQLLTSLLEFCR